MAEWYLTDQPAPDQTLDKIQKATTESTGEKKQKLTKTGELLTLEKGKGGTDTR